MLTAMAAGFSAATASSAWAQQAQAVPVKGGHLRLGLAGGSSADTLNPGPWGDTFMVILGYGVRAGLVEFGADGTLKPDVAESWEFSNGAKTWIFKIRRGATFSNGKPITADDVVASLNFHRGAKSTSGAKAIFEYVTDIKADGQDTVVVTLSTPVVDFAYSLTDHHINMMLAVDGEADWRSGIGPGPFMIEQFTPGVRAVLKRNPNSYRNAYFDSVEMLSIPDVVARQSALTSRALDAINRVDLKTAGLMGRTRGIRVAETAGRLHYWLVANAQVAPFNNNDVMLALKHGINRKEILDVVFHGHGSIGNDQPITPTYRYHDAQLAAKPYDPDKARFYLKRAGMENLKVDLHISDASFSGAVDTGVLYQQQAAKAGININVIREAPDTYMAKLAVSKPDWFSTFWSGRATEDTMFTVGMSKDSPWNYCKWDNPEFNKLLVVARAETDEAKRRGMYGELQRIASDQATVVIPIFANSVHAVADKVKSPQQLAGNWELDGARCLERWWMAA
jgi:peptide/nickel transport system substrate-binding protein